uniref:Tubulin--tyrosine ligase-like protein 12 SET-like domain-containing protein n=1 Tax=Homalodisca liturata TaxID=320908 RepID=A0A1B6J2G9_9HEMI
MDTTDADNSDVNEIYSVDEKDYLLFVNQHEPQLKFNNIPELFWKCLCLKLKNQIFDAGNTFSMFYVENDESEDDNGTLQTKVIVSTDFIDITDGNHIYLIDHAWTFKANEAKHHLREVSGLLERMSKLVNVPLESENAIEEVYNRIWKFNQTYSCSALSNIEDQLPVWYVMDEFGSAIQHSDCPNFRVVPFLHIPEGIAYSVLFPIKTVKRNDDVTRDYVESITDDLERKARLIPWKEISLRNIPFTQTEPAEEYFSSGRRNESLPNLSALIPKDTNGTVPDTKPLKVFSQYSFINENLTSSKFSVVTDEKDADILWLTSHFKQYKEFSEEFPAKFINQFPFESVITIKDLLAIICRRKTDNFSGFNSRFESQPNWLPTTFNLTTELTKFVSYFQHRQDENLNNHWICKPWNLARGMDTFITDNLSCIIRLSSSGPKIAQKYIENPVLFHRDGIGSVKFDVRYVILLKSVDPLEVYVYKNFFLRFANKPFALSDFDDYEKHFTVMNYTETATLHRLLCSDFIREYNIQYPEKKWREVEPKILTMFREVFESATCKNPPCGIGKNPQSRALYAADLMLSKKENGEVEPKLLEINWMPDCQRASEYYPDFYNDIFELLFLDEEKDVFHKVA